MVSGPDEALTTCANINGGRESAITSKESCKLHHTVYIYCDKVLDNPEVSISESCCGEREKIIFQTVSCAIWAATVGAENINRLIYNGFTREEIEFIVVSRDKAQNTMSFLSRNQEEKKWRYRPLYHYWSRSQGISQKQAQLWVEGNVYGEGGVERHH